MTEYAKGGRDVRELDRSGGHFSRHMAAMTDENLHDKGDIAAELAWRDARIAELEQRVKVLEDALKCARCVLLNAKIKTSPAYAAAMELAKAAYESSNKDALRPHVARVIEVFNGYCVAAECEELL